uniref:Uncharacterized protein n=1 Tax=Chrysemys picta bellii TaxID=8478 RepID=A0A8C3F3S7_CHRPI
MTMFREMKSLWNCGSITCIMYLIWEGSQRSMSSSRASSFSGPLHLWGERQRETRNHPQTETPYRLMTDNVPSNFFHPCAEQM